MSLNVKESKLTKRQRHSHFWIEDGVLYESYFTIRGRRYGFKLDVPGMPNEDRCSGECLNYIEKEYL